MCLSIRSVHGVSRAVLTDKYSTRVKALVPNPVSVDHAKLAMCLRRMLKVHTRSARATRAILCRRVGSRKRSGAMTTVSLRLRARDHYLPPIRCLGQRSPPELSLPVRAPDLHALTQPLA